MTGPRTCSIVLCADGEKADKRTHASIRSQTHAPLEIIEANTENDHAGALNTAFKHARGDLIAVVDSGDTLAPDALSRLCERAYDDVDIVYSDEDRLASSDPSSHTFFKPDWSPDRLCCQQYIGRLCALRRVAVEGVGGIRLEVGNACEWDLLLRLGEQGRRIEHVPEVLYHRAPGVPIDGIRTDEDRHDAQRVCNEHLQRSGVGAEVAFDPTLGVFRLNPALRDTPKVSIVIPTAGSKRWVWGHNVSLILGCMRSIVELSSYTNYEIVCVVDENVDGRLRDELLSLNEERIRCVDYREPFNFSRKVNLGVRESDGEHIVLLNDDTQIITPGWLEHLLVYSMQPGVGIAGSTLRFADGRLQHVGVLIVEGHPGHPYYGFPASTRGYFDVNLVPSNLLAVTAACLMTSRATFEGVGGFGEEFPANYNDVDFCLKVHTSGARVVHTPEAELFHFESSSREGGAVAEHETELLHNRWGAVLMRDPFYNPNFLATADYLTPIVEP